MNLKMSKKAFIFLPDGVGLRNFALTNFNAIGTALGYEIVYWNNTPFKIKEELGYDEVNITNHQLHPWTTVYTRARKRCELNVFDKKFKLDNKKLTQEYKRITAQFKELQR